MAFLLSPSLYVSDAMLPRLSEREGEERGAAHCVGASSVVQWSRRRAERRYASAQTKCRFRGQLFACFRGGVYFTAKALPPGQAAGDRRTAG